MHWAADSKRFDATILRHLDTENFRKKKKENERLLGGWAVGRLQNDHNENDVAQSILHGATMYTDISNNIITKYTHSICIHKSYCIPYVIRLYFSNWWKWWQVIDWHPFSRLYTSSNSIRIKMNFMQNAQTKQINVKTIWITPEITTKNHNKKKKENRCGLKPHSDVNY